MSHVKRNIWGPAAWTFLHAAAASADDPAAFAQLVALLPHTLPCQECRQHCGAFLERRPPAAEVRDAATASRYLYDFHNDVNARLGRATAPARLVEARYGVVLPAPAQPQARFDRVRPYRRI